MTNKFLLVIVVTFFLVIFCNWISLGLISSGDYPFFFREAFLDRLSLPFVWQAGYVAPFLNSFPLTLATGILAYLGLSFVLIERIVWFWPILLLCFVSPYFFGRHFLKDNFLYWPVLIVFSLNSYFLMIAGGGQVGILLSYSLAPLIFTFFDLNFEKFIQTKTPDSLTFILLNGIGLAFLLSADLRIFLIVILSILLFGVFNYLSFFRKVSLKYILFFLGSTVLSFLLHSYWIFPVLLTGRTSIPFGYQSSSWVDYLSFSQFSGGLALLHPNWPENIFGKTYFFNPLFLVLPLVAFSSLLFINFKKKKEAIRIIFFVLVGLFGGFLSKGVNLPFGQFYLFIFEKVPGGSLFRDPTKFYLLVVLSYIFLIPFSLRKIYLFLLRFSKKLAGLSTIFFVVLFLFLIKPAWTGQLQGTFKAREIPQPYLELKEFLASDDSFARVLWLPKRQRFGFYSNNHPAIDSEDFFGPNYCLVGVCKEKVDLVEDWGRNCPVNDRCYVKELAFLLDPRSEDLLRELAIGYLVIPFDPFGEIFIDNYKYNSQQRQEVEQFLDQINWLGKINVAEKITAYKTKDAKDHFFVEGQTGIEINWQQINPTKYKVKVNGMTGSSFNLVFSEKYDPLWQAKINGQTIDSQEYRRILNSFVVENEGELDLIIEFKPQKYSYFGGIISLTVLAGAIACLVYLSLKK